MPAHEHARAQRAPAVAPKIFQISVEVRRRFARAREPKELRATSLSQGRTAGLRARRVAACLSSGQVHRRRPRAIPHERRVSHHRQYRHWHQRVSLRKEHPFPLRPDAVPGLDVALQVFRRPQPRRAPICAHCDTHQRTRRSQKGDPPHTRGLADATAHTAYRRQACPAKRRAHLRGRRNSQNSRRRGPTPPRAEAPWEKRNSHAAEDLLAASSQRHRARRRTPRCSHHQCHRRSRGPTRGP